MKQRSHRASLVGVESLIVSPPPSLSSACVLLPLPRTHWLLATACVFGHHDWKGQEAEAGLAHSLPSAYLFLGCHTKQFGKFKVLVQQFLHRSNDFPSSPHQRAPVYTAPS